MPLPIPTGLLIFQTNESAGFYFYNGEQWTRIEGAGFEQNSECTEGITEVVAGYGCLVEVILGKLP